MKYLPNFSHIYIERSAREYPLTHTILKRFKRSLQIELDDYKRIFARPRQDWREQKRSQKLILAVKKSDFLYEAGEVQPHFEGGGSYYAALAMNCPFDCEYCFLQGMYPSANLVVFVNFDDYENAILAKLESEGTFNLALSYTTDLLAIEQIASYCESSVLLASRNPALNLELRTKSTNIKALLKLRPVENVTIAWTLSPDTVAKSYERGAPALKARLRAISQVQLAGWKVRLCFDPLIAVDNWQEVYTEFLSEV
ncbi:MAG: DNA photolyase, partial [Proteobacteria bacterium]